MSGCDNLRDSGLGDKTNGEPGGAGGEDVGARDLGRLASDGVDCDLSQVVANLTHELKTPLHAILTVAELLLSGADGDLGEEQRRQVGIIVRNGEKLLELIEDLLSFSRMESRGVRIRPKRLRMRTVADGLLDTARPLAEKAGVALEVSCKPEGAHFVCDEYLLRRIVGNLVGNAIKFSPDGGTVSLLFELTDEGYLKILVADSGIGIPAEVREAVFGEFYQADSGDARRFGGVGLGLSLVRNAVELLGGSIELKSERGQGSLFEILISPASLHSPSAKVMVMEASESVATALSEAFEESRYRIEFVSESGDLMSRISALRPDLLLLGEVPEEDELSLLKKLEASPWHRHISVIVLSSFDDPAKRRMAFEHGASDYILKPFDVAELVARVNVQLERAWR